MFPYHTISLFFTDLFYFKAKLNESKAFIYLFIYFYIQDRNSTLV